MPLYEVTLEQSFANQQIINRWNYVGDAVPAGESGAALALQAMGAIAPPSGDAFGVGTVLGDLRPLQSTDVIFVQIIARNIYSVTDFMSYAFPPNTYGENTGGQSLSPTAAVGLTSDRTRADIRRAQKRFTGICEPDVVGKGELSGSALAGWQVLGDTMGDIMIGVGAVTPMTFTPHVFGRIDYPTPSGKTAYKYYSTEVLQREHIARINQWNLKRQVRTQASRQYGRGS